MMLAWMAYIGAVTLLAGGASVAAEHCLRALGRPARWGWAAGMLASVIVPLVAFVFPGRAGFREVRALPLPLLFDSPAGSWAGPWTGVGTLPTRLSGLDLPLLTLWILGSLGVVLLGVVVQRRLVSSALHCNPDRVAGVDVRCTRRFGPAVVGCIKGQIVLPDWARSMGDEPLRLSLAHEREHLRARDPLLFFGAYLLVALQPWNPALWWQLSRLKRAIEADCDRRVLAQGADPRAYASLLLTLAARKSRPLLFALGLRKPKSRVGRRIAAMADGVAGVRSRWAPLAAGLGACFLVAAFQVRAPGARPFLDAGTFEENSAEVAQGPRADSSVLEASPTGLWATLAGPPEGGAAKASLPSPREFPIVARGDDAHRILTGLREQIARTPDEKLSVEVPLEGGALLRLTGRRKDFSPVATLVLHRAPGDPAESRAVSLRLDIIDGEPVLTLEKV